jgi:hypothetical protein
MEKVMATAKNDVTGDWIQSKPNSDMFEKNFDLIFRKKKPSDDVSPHLHEYELDKSTGEVIKKECNECKCGVKGCD